MSICTDQILGPVLSVIRVQSHEEGMSGSTTPTATERRHLRRWGCPGSRTRVQVGMIGVNVFQL